MSFEWFEWSAVLIVLQLIYLEGILSIDNAAVLGAMVAHLPHDEPVPWPRPLQFLQRPIHLLLGGQRTAALKAGLLGAYLGRGTMLFAASWVLHALARPARWAGQGLVRLGALAIAAVGGWRAGTVPGSSSSRWSRGDGRR